MSKTLENLREPVRCWACGAWGEVQHMCGYAPDAFAIVYGLQCFLCAICTATEDVSRDARDLLAQAVLGPYKRPHYQEAFLRSIVVGVGAPMAKEKEMKTHITLTLDQLTEQERKDLTYLLTDALAEFAGHREPPEKYIAERYADYMSEGQRRMKTTELERRIALAKKLKAAAHDMDVTDVAEEL